MLHFNFYVFLCVVYRLFGIFNLEAKLVFH